MDVNHAGAYAAFGLVLTAFAAAGCVRSDSRQKASSVRAPDAGARGRVVNAASPKSASPPAPPSPHDMHDALPVAGDESTQSLCTTAPRVTVRDRGVAFRADGRTHHNWQIQIGPTWIFDEGAIDEWRIDLNADGLVDLAVSGRDSCASGGCLSAIYLNCGGGTYVTIAAPRYVESFRPATTRTTTPTGESWLDIKVHVKDRSHPSREGIRTVIWRFDGTTYR